MQEVTLHYPGISTSRRPATFLSLINGQCRTLRLPRWQLVRLANRFANGFALVGATASCATSCGAAKGCRGWWSGLRDGVEKRGRGNVGTGQFVKAGKEPSVLGYDWRMPGTIATAFCAFVIGRVSPRPGIPGMRRERGGRYGQLVACILTDTFLRSQTPFVCHENVISRRDSATDKFLPAEFTRVSRIRRESKSCGSLSRLVTQSAIIFL